ncbi:hypothetical protein FRB94_000922, partial [Tulasnella sp. JGI-2019a]
MSELTGFAETEKLTFSKYTSAPIRGLKYTFPCPEDIPSLPKIVQIPVEHLREVKNRLLPIKELDLSAMAAVGLLPKTFEYSRPDVNPQSKFFAIASLNVNSLADIHKAIYHVTLANLHYGYRLRAFLYEWGLLQRHPDGMVDMVPGMDDPVAKDLLEQEAGNASQRMWYHTPIFNDEEKDDSLGFASWLWADTGIIEALEGGQKFQANGSVLFTFAPYWIMPKGEMDLISDPNNERSKPDWLTGIHAFCRESGTHHVIVYNGDSVVLGVFNASFDEVKFSASLWVDIGKCGHFGYGTSDSGLGYISPEDMDVSLIQVLTQVMVEAKASQIVPIPTTEATATASAPNTLITALQFPFAPISKNGDQPKLTGTKAETEYAMRFSRRTNFHQLWPTQEESERVRARSRKAAEQRSNKIAAPALAPAPTPTLAPAPAAVSHMTQVSRALSLALAIRPPSSSSGSLKRPRPHDDEATLPLSPRHKAPVLRLHRRRAMRSVRAAPTRNAEAGLAIDRHSASAMVETRRGEELLRPTKRPRTVAPIVAPLLAASAAAPHNTQASAVHSLAISAQPRSSTSGSLKRQRADELTPQALSDGGPSQPEKRPRITTATAPSAIAPANAGNAARHDDGPLATRRPLRHAATHGMTYAERQVKLAEASDSKKRGDLKNKVKAVKAAPSASRRSRMSVTKVEDAEVEESVNRSDLMEVNEPQPATLPVPKAKAVVAPKNTKKMKKAVAVKESSKKAL